MEAKPDKVNYGNMLILKRKSEIAEHVMPLNTNCIILPCDIITMFYSLRLPGLRWYQVNKFGCYRKWITRFQTFIRPCRRKLPRSQSKQSTGSGTFIPQYSTCADLLQYARECEANLTVGVSVFEEVT